MKDVYTTGEISKMLRVAPRTVAHWIDNGLLSGFRVPLGHGTKSTHRRVKREDLISFVLKNNLPMSLLVSESRKWRVCVGLQVADLRFVIFSQWGDETLILLQKKEFTERMQGGAVWIEPEYASFAERVIHVPKEFQEVTY